MRVLRRTSGDAGDPLALTLAGAQPHSRPISAKSGASVVPRMMSAPGVPSESASTARITAAAV